MDIAPDTLPAADEFTPDASPYVIADRLRMLREMERELNARRLEVERRLLHVLRFARQEGRETYDLEEPDGQSIRVVVKANLRRSIDEAALPEALEGLPPELHPLRYEPRLDLRAFRALEGRAGRDAFVRFCRAVVSKPNKPTVDVGS